MPAAGAYIRPGRRRLACRLELEVRVDVDVVDLPLAPVAESGEAERDGRLVAVVAAHAEKAGRQRDPARRRPLRRRAEHGLPAHAGELRAVDVQHLDLQPGRGRAGVARLEAEERRLLIDAQRRGRDRPAARDEDRARAGRAAGDLRSAALDDRRAALEGPTLERALDV